jgi:hypothetical protein
MSEWVVLAGTLGGVAIGAVIGFAGTMLTDRREGFFQQQRRSDAKKDRRTEHELAAIAESRAILDEMAKGATSFNTAVLQVLDEERGGSEIVLHIPESLRVSSLAEMNGLRSRLMLRTAMLHGQDLRDALDYYAAAVFTLVGSTDFEGALAVGAEVRDRSLLAAQFLAARERQLLAEN